MADGGNNKEIVKALETVVKLLIGDELQALKDSVKSMELDVTRKIDACKNETSSVAENVRKDLAAEKKNITADIGELGRKIKELTEKTDGVDKKISKEVKKLSDSLSSLDDRTGNSILGLGSRIDTGINNVEKNMNVIQETLKKETLGKVDIVGKRIDGIERTMVNHQQEIDDQGSETKRISGLLNNFAQVFTGGGGITQMKQQVIQQAQTTAPSVSDSPAPKEKPAQIEKEDENALPDSGSIEKGIDDMFKL